VLNNKNICSAADLWNVSENFSVDILNNLNSVRESLNLNFITMKSKELLAEKGREKFHE